MKKSAQKPRQRLKPWLDPESIELAFEKWGDLLKDRDHVLYRLRAEHDAFWFEKHILGFTRIVRHLHGEMIEFCQDSMHHESEQHVLIVPRQCFKSTTCNVGLNAHSLLCNPDLRIVIGADIDDSSRDFSAQIKRIFARNHKVRTLWPDVVWENPTAEAPSWSNDSWTLKRDYDDRVSSMSVMSVKSGAIGYHFHVICLDDVVTRENVQTREQKRMVKAFVKDCYNLRRRPDEILPTGGRLRMIGTPWAVDDANMELLEDEDVPRYWRGIFGEPGRTTGADEDIIFPEEFTQDSIRRMKKRLLDKAASQLFCSAKTEESEKFKKEWVRWYKPGQHPPLELMNIYTSVDPNRSESDKHDPISIMTAGFDGNGRLWLLDHQAGHPSLNEMVLMITDQCKRWQPEKVFIETVGAQLWLITPLQERFLQLRLSTRIVKVDRPPIKKDVRIMSLQSPAEMGGLFFPESTQGRYVERELLNFGSGGHDDSLDTLSDIYVNGKPPSRTKVVKTIGPTKETARKLYELQRSPTSRVVMGPGSRVSMGMRA